MFISIIYAVTSTGCAAFSKSLCVPYMQVWCTQVLWFPSISGPLSVTELRSWLSKPAVFIFFFPETDLQIFQISQASWKDKKTHDTGIRCLIWRVLWTRSIYFKPFIYAAFMIYTQARQSCYGISLLQFFKAYCTFPSIFTQHILIIGYSWLC